MTDTNTGWKLVPLVPTPEMMQQYQHAFVSAERFDGAKVYRAMVDAAPPGPKYSEDVLRDFIAIEKRLCEILGRPWAPSGFSIETLCADIKARLTNAPVAVTRRCLNCDDTGDVHSITGEWRGRCHCAAGRNLGDQVAAAILQAADARKEGLRGAYPMAAQILAEEVFRLRGELASARGT